MRRCQPRFVEYMPTPWSEAVVFFWFCERQYMGLLLVFSGMDNLLVLWESFSLIESKGNMYQVDDGGLNGKFLLAASFLLVKR